MGKLVKWTIWILVTPPIVWVSTIGGGYLVYRVRGYQQRPIECAPQELLPELEKVFGVDFPKTIKDIRAAKSIPIEGYIDFIFKFDAEPNIVDMFLNSLPPVSFMGKEQPIKFKEYKRESDQRSAFIWPPPKWFTAPIAKGKTAEYDKSYRQAEFYIDTTNEKSFVVYIKGSYSKTYAEQRQ